MEEKENLTKKLEKTKNHLTKELENTKHELVHLKSDADNLKERNSMQEIELEKVKGMAAYQFHLLIDLRIL